VDKQNINNGTGSKPKRNSIAYAAVQPQFEFADSQLRQMAPGRRRDSKFRKALQRTTKSGTTTVVAKGIQSIWDKVEKNS
jgi:hypothetical protein